MIEWLKNVLLSGDGCVISLVGAGGKTSLMFRLAREAVMAGDSVLTTTTTRIMHPNENQSPKVFLAKTAQAILDGTYGFQRENLHLTAASGSTDDGEKLIGFEPAIIDTLYRSGRFKWIMVEADGAARKWVKAPAVHEPVIPRSTDRVIGVAGLKAIGKPLMNQWVFRPEIFAKITGLESKARVTVTSVAKSIVAPDGILKGTPPGARQFVFLNLAGDLQSLAHGQELARRLSRSTELPSLDGVIIGNAHDEPAVLEYYHRPLV